MCLRVYTYHPTMPLTQSSSKAAFDGSNGRCSQWQFLAAGMLTVLFPTLLLSQVSQLWVSQLLVNIPFCLEGGDRSHSLSDSAEHTG